MDDGIREFQRALDRMETVDLSHTLEENMPVWPTHPRFFHNLMESYVFGDVSCHYQLIVGEHTGTHIDAPLHFVSEGPKHYGIDQVPLEVMRGRAVTIQAVDTPPNGLLTRHHLEAWEAANGRIQAGDVLLIRFGWDKYWALHPEDAKFLADWPGLSENAAEYLVEKGVKLVGTDAIALDVFGTTEHIAHRVLLNHEVLIVENLNNLDKLPPFSYFMGFPLKILHGSGSPMRAIAVIPKQVSPV